MIIERYPMMNNEQIIIYDCFYFTENLCNYLFNFVLSINNK